MIVAEQENRRRSLPPGGAWRRWNAADGWPIRLVEWQAPRPRGAILFVGGRADFIEKYCESYWTWRDWGLDVVAFDWRGQGRSGRLGDHPHKGHAMAFEPWVEDLAGLARWFRGSRAGPHFIVAHSMGGHLLLRLLAVDARAIDRAVLLAPMLGIHTGPLPAAVAARLAGWIERIGAAGAFAPFQGPYDGAMRARRRQPLLTGDADRFADEAWWIEADGALALGGVTYGWLASAYRSIATLFAPGAMERIATPLLILMGESERLVDARAAERAVARLPDARYERMAGAAHELLRERDATRALVQARIRRFLLEDVP